MHKCKLNKTLNKMKMKTKVKVKVKILKINTINNNKNIKMEDEVKHWLNINIFYTVLKRIDKNFSN